MAGSTAVTMRSFALECSMRITSCEALLIRRFSDLRRYSSVTALFLAASRLGDGPLWWATAAVLLSFGGRGARSAVLAAGLGVGASILLFLCLKRLTGRPRPFEVWGDLPCLLAAPDCFSFPSGHTMTAFTVWSAFAQLLPGSSYVFLPIGVVIGLSRIFLGLHYPTDVLAGGLLGSGLGYGAARLVGAVLG